VIDTIPPGEVVSVERETFPGLIGAGETVMGFVDPSYWLDVGTPAAFVRGSCDLVLGELSSPALPGEPGPSLALEGASVSPRAVITDGTIVGAGAVVEAGSTVSGSVIFDEAVVAKGAWIRNSVLGRGAKVASGSMLDGAILGDGAIVGPGNELGDGLRLWPGIELPPTAVRMSSDV
jgi:mannose-1-phosphate guanylyltransferase